MNKFIGYGKQSINKSDINSVVQILKGDYLTQGPTINAFEKKICEYTGSKYCVAVSNGTAALHLAVAALRINEGNEGITSTISFAASANCLVYNKLTPVLCDINEQTYNIEPNSIINNITSLTKVIIPVHFAGQSADMNIIYRIAQKYNLKIIEDAAHAIGSKYSDGSRIGNCRYSDMTIFSFHPVKTITTGEGGAITTNNEEYYKILCLLRSHGITKDSALLEHNPGPWYYEMQEIGFNYRLTDFQAALGISQLNRLDEFINRRREIVATYNKAFSKIEWLSIPYEKPDLYSAFHLYILKFNFTKIGKSRKQVMTELSNNNIGTQVHYIPIHTHPYYKRLFNRNITLPVAEAYYEQALSIPLYPAMTNEDINYVITKIKNIKE